MPTARYRYPFAARAKSLGRGHRSGIIRRLDISLVNGRFVCEAFPAQKLPFTDADPAQLQAHLDGQRKHQQEMKKTICRINQSVAGILPPDAAAAAASEKTQLRSHCYAAALGEQTPALSDNEPPLPDSPEMTPAAGVCQTKTSPSSIQEVLSFLFGE